MAQIPDQMQIARIRLSTTAWRSMTGHVVGVSVGGRGVPLVFMHGLALSRRAYVRMLNRVEGLGLLVMAIVTCRRW